MTTLKRIIEEAHRRSLWQVLGIYLVAGWIAVQVVQTLTESLGLPGWFPAFAVVLLVIGLPIVLATAFVQEGKGAEATSATGITATEPGLAGAPAGGSTRGGLRRLLTWRNALTGGVLALALWGVVAGGWLLLGTGAAPGVADSATGEHLSVAVLPFANLSGDEAAEPFTAGIHDDVLTQLSKIASLKVISRTSVMEYRNTTKNIRQIADELGVATVLEGGVQQAGTRLRINAQLVDAGTDEHLWAETFDRDLSAANVFAIQSEIARSIADALRAELTPEEARELGSTPTTNLEALDYFHRGKALLARRANPDADTAAVAALERAVELDPSFAQAWAALTGARSWLIRTDLAWDTTPARRALVRAVALAPGAVETELARGYYDYYAQGDFDRALEHFKAAESRWPGNAEVVEAIGFILRRQGRWSESVAYAERHAELDPRDAAGLADLGFSYSKLRRYAEAERMLERALVLAPDLTIGHAWRFDVVLWGLGDSARARSIAEETASSVDPRAAANWTADLALVQRDHDAAIAALRTQPAGDRAAERLGRLWRLATTAQMAGDAALARLYADSLRAAAERELEARAARGGESFGRLSGVHSALGAAHAILGHRQEAVHEAERAVELYPVSRDAAYGPQLVQGLAQVYILVGEHDRAIDRLEYLLSIPSFVSRAGLRLNRLYDPLRADPRFAALVAGG